MKVGEVPEVTSLKPLIGFDFFDKLEMKGHQRVKRTLHFVGIQSVSDQFIPKRIDPVFLSLDAVDSLFMFCVVPDHVNPLNLMIPFCMSFLREMRNAEGKSSSTPKRSVIPEP